MPYMAQCLSGITAAPTVRGRRGGPAVLAWRLRSAHLGRMTVLQLVPVALSALVLAAHFLREGNSIFVLAALGIFVLIFVRRRWAARLIQLGLLLGTLEWIHTLVVLVSFRMQSGAPFRRLALIIGSVAALTAASALLLQTRTLRRRFQLAAR